MGCSSHSRSERVERARGQQSRYCEVRGNVKWLLILVRILLVSVFLRQGGMRRYVFDQLAVFIIDSCLMSSFFFPLRVAWRSGEVEKRERRVFFLIWKFSFSVDFFTLRKQKRKHLLKQKCQKHTIRLQTQLTITTKEALEFKDLATREVFFEKVQEKKKKANRQTLLLTATQQFRALPPEDEDEDVDEGEEAEEGVKEPCGHALCFFQDFDCIFPKSIAFFRTGWEKRRSC